MNREFAASMLVGRVGETPHVDDMVKTIESYLKQLAMPKKAIGHIPSFGTRNSYWAAWQAKNDQSRYSVIYKHNHDSLHPRISVILDQSSPAKWAMPTLLGHLYDQFGGIDAKRQLSADPVVPAEDDYRPLAAQILDQDRMVPLVYLKGCRLDDVMRLSHDLRGIATIAAEPTAEFRDKLRDLLPARLWHQDGEAILFYKANEEIRSWPSKLGSLIHRLGRIWTYRVPDFDQVRSMYLESMVEAMQKEISTLKGINGCSSGLDQAIVRHLHENTQVKRHQDRSLVLKNAYEAVDLAAMKYAQTLIVPQSVLNKVKKNTFDKTAILYKALEWLATDYIKFRGNRNIDADSLNISCMKACGMQYAGEYKKEVANSNKFASDYHVVYKGKNIPVLEHLSYGVGTDERYTIRIQFAYLFEEKKVIIGKIHKHPSTHNGPS